MQIRYTVPKLLPLQRKLLEGPAALEARHVSALRQAVELVATLVRGRIPLGPGRWGGHLRDSFTTKVFANNLRSFGSIRTTLVQGRWREYGTKPHPIGKGKRMSIGGRVVTGPVQHPGQKPRRALHAAMRQAKPQIRAWFQEALGAVAQDLGNG